MTRAMRKKRDPLTVEEFDILQRKPVMHITEAANYLDISEKLARRLANAGVIPSFKLGRRQMCSRLALDEFVAKKGGLR